MSKYPSNWTQTQIGDVFSVKRGDSSLTKSSYCKSGTLAYSGTGPDGFVQECQNRGKGIIISSVGAQCGKVFKASGSWTAINNTIAITEKESRYDIDYLYFILERQEVLHREGGAQPFISQKEVMGALINFPSLPEQKKIAEILSGIDSFSSCLQELKRKKKKLLSALLTDIFDQLTSCAILTRIGDICEVKRGASPRPIQDRRWWGNGRGWTRISDVTSAGKYLFSTKDRLSQKGEERSISINPGEIILSICATIGLPIIVRTPVCIHDGFVWFDGASISATSEYMYYYFLSIRKHLLSGRQIGAQGNLNTSIVADQIIPIPSRETQDKVVGMMSNVEDQIKALETKIQSVSILKAAIAADLLSGRKRVTI